MEEYKKPFILSMHNQNNPFFNSKPTNIQFRKTLEMNLIQYLLCYYFAKFMKYANI